MRFCENQNRIFNTMLSFFPGTSKTNESLAAWFAEATERNICALPHRSKEFSDIYRDILRLFREKMLLPENYGLYFVSSASEVWDILNRAFSSKETLHLINGAFGEKWFQWRRKNGDGLGKAHFYDFNEDFSANEIVNIPEVICVTHC